MGAQALSVSGKHLNPLGQTETRLRRHASREGCRGGLARQQCGLRRQAPMCTSGAVSAETTRDLMCAGRGREEHHTANCRAPTVWRLNKFDQK